MSEAPLPLVVLTGAAGRVGRRTAQSLAGRYRLRLVDLDWPDDVAADPLDDALDDAERVAVDLHERSAWTGVLDGADVVVHLAAQPSPQIEVREALEDVAMPTARLCEVVGGSSVRRVVYASSIHALGLYDRDGRYPVDPAWPARPCCEYGAAKVLGENLLALLVERSGTTVACLRLGLTGAAPRTPYAVGQWLGDGDLSRLVVGAIESDVAFGSYFGVSVLGRDQWDVASAEADLGYRPQDVADPPTEEDPPPEPGQCLMRG